MPTLEDQERLEYAALMKRGNDAERTGQLCWTAGALTAAVMLSWGISAHSPGLMIPVVFALAAGFYTMLRGRQQVRWIGSYIEQFCEQPKGPQWFGRLRMLQSQPGFRTVGDWLTLTLANAGVVLALILAWVYAGGGSAGDRLRGMATTVAVVLGFP